MSYVNSKRRSHQQALAQCNDNWWDNMIRQDGTVNHMPKFVMDRLKTLNRDIIHTGHMIQSSLKEDAKLLKVMGMDVTQHYESISGVNKATNNVAYIQTILKNVIAGKMEYTHGELQRLEKHVTQMYHCARNARGRKLIGEIQWYLRKHKASLNKVVYTYDLESI